MPPVSRLTAFGLSLLVAAGCAGPDGRPEGPQAPAAAPAAAAAGGQPPRAAPAGGSGGAPEIPLQVPRHVDLLVPDGSVLSELVRIGVEWNASRSSGEGLIAQRRAERQARRWEGFPNVAPVANMTTDGEREVGVAATVPVYDFGWTRARGDQARLAIDLAEIEYWTERTRVAQDILALVVDAAAARRRVELTVKSRDEVRSLSTLAEGRTASGVADLSELTLLSLRLAEIESEVASDEALLQQALGLLSDRIGLPVPIANVPSLASIGSIFRRPGTRSTAPGLLRAHLQRRTAEAQLRQIDAERLPRLVLRGTMVFDKDSEFEHSAAVAFETSSFLGFAGGDNISAARSGVVAAEAAVRGAEEAVATERNRLARERARLRRQIEAFEELIEQGGRSVGLFQEQLGAGSRPITDGITVFRTLLDAELNLVRATADTLRNRVVDAALEGRLVLCECKVLP